MANIAQMLNSEFLRAERAETELATLRADNERLNRELDDVWDALAIQREDNVSFGDAFKRMTSEIERLRAALREHACECVSVCMDAKHNYGEIDTPDTCKYGRATAALAEEKKDG